VLFLLGLPNKPPALRGHHVDLSGEAFQQGAATVSAVLAGGPNVLDSAFLAAAVAGQRKLGKAKEIDFKTLEAAAYTPEDRDYWKGKAITVRGQFVPSPRNKSDFSLVRIRINCCAADAQQLNVPMRSDEPLNGLNSSQWVKVTGRVDFAASPGRDRFLTILRVPGQDHVVPCDPDTNPYIQ